MILHMSSRACLVLGPQPSMPPCFESQASRQYREGEYVVIEVDDAADLMRQAFDDLGSHTDDAPPPDPRQTGPLPGGPPPR